MMINFGFGRLYIGRLKSINKRRNAGVALYLASRGLVPPGELPWHFAMVASWNWLPDCRYLPITVGHKRALDSSRWTGRSKKFVGYGDWQREFAIHRTTRRSLMYVYLTGQKERANPNHKMYVCPGHGMTAAELPVEWKGDTAERPRTFIVEFKHGRASVDSQLGEWMVKTGHAQRSNIVVPEKGMLGSLASKIAGR